ncbi:MAG: TlpA disulfide reductase family protein [Pseudomonadota bacterium]|nr:TlpA disulfide reductase family protein [Pseudomonadota bacterium]
MTRLARCFFVAAVIVAAAFPSAAARGVAQERAPLFGIRGIDGRIFSMNDHGRKTVLLVFGTTWCASCRSEIPHFKEIYHAYTPRGLVMASIDIQESQDKVARFAARYRLPYRVLLDETGAVAAAYRIVGVPTMVLIDNGSIVTRNYRQVDGALRKLFPK